MREHNLDFHVSGILTNPQEQWGRIKRASMGKNRVAFRKLDVDWKKYNTNDYLFTHDTACCSVETEENGYWITPPCWELVNANGNAWTTPVLLASFKTFIGGENYCFPKGTRVLMSDGTYKNIEDIQIGDSVINAKGEKDTVSNVFCHLYSGKMCRMTLFDGAIGNNIIKCTSNHPFLVFCSDELKYVNASELNMESMELINPQKNVRIKFHKEDYELDKEIIVYNFETQNDHSYIAEGVAVHNCEHVQIPALSKGKILDAIARPVVHHSEKYGDAHIYYIDLLIATSRKHANLVERIESGKLRTLSMGCHVDGTKVLMADGTTKNIEEIQVGDTVFTHKNNIAVVESTKRRMTEPNELHRLCISGMPDTYVTAEHPYWTFIGYDKCKGCGKPLHAHKRGSLTERDLVMWCGSSCFQTHCNTMKKEHDEFFKQEIKFDWKRVDELEEGNWVAIPLGREENIERKSLGKAKSRLLGYFLAEGNFQGKEKKYAVEYTFSSSEMNYIDEIRGYALEIGIPEDKIYVQVRESKTNARIVIHDKEFAQWMYDNAGEHSWEKKINPELLEYDDETLKNIIGSYINGDGHMTKRDQKVSVCSVSKELIEQISTMMRLVGIPNIIYCSRKQKEGDNCRANYTVLICQGHAGKLMGYCDKCADVPIHKNVNEYNGYMLRRVLKNETLSMTTYVNNIHVVNKSEDHSFIANGIAVHNCIAEATQCSICGKIIGDNDKNCEHIDKHLGQMVTCQDGKERICAELCGCCDENGNYVENSNRFIECSFVENPAFKGSVVNAFVETEEIKAVREEERDELAKLFEGNLFERLKVADTDSKIALNITKKIGKVERISDTIMRKI